MFCGYAFRYKQVQRSDSNRLPLVYKTGAVPLSDVGTTNLLCLAYLKPTKIARKLAAGDITKAALVVPRRPFMCN
jgi:hypothetical protein